MPYDFVKDPQDSMDALTISPGDAEADEVLADMKMHAPRIILSPKRWATWKSTISLEWSMVPFKKSEKTNVPEDKSGVYTFVIKPTVADHPANAYLLYVGKTEKQSLRTRFNDYFSEAKKPKGRAPIKGMLRHWIPYLWFCFAPVDKVEDIFEIEELLIGAFVPPANQEYPGVLGVAEKMWNIL